MLQVKKDKRGIDNILGLLRYTFPKVTRVVTPSHITVASRPIGDPPGDHNMELTVTGISETTTGEVVLPYQAFDLTNCDCPSEIAAEMFSLTQVKAFLATKPIAIDELDFTKEGDAYRVSAVEGAFTVFGEKVFTLAEDPEDPEEDEDPEPEPEPEDPEEDEDPEPEPEPEDPEEDGDGEEEDLGDGSDWGYGELFDKTDNRPTPAVAGTWFEDQYGWNYTVASPEELKTIVSNYLTAEDPRHIATITAGGQTHDIPLNNIDIRLITSTKNLFSGASDFNQDIGRWDMSNVTDAYSMFDNCSKFNRYIGDWDVSKVQNFRNMFFGCTEFNQDISKWDVSSATRMDMMFKYCNAFDRDLSGWCVTNITELPTDFTLGTKLVLALRPVWGTCPVRPPVDEPVPGERPAARSGHWYKYKGEMFYVAKTKYELEEIVEPYLDATDPHHVVPLTRVNQTHSIPLNNIDIRLITDLSSLFRDKTTFNQDISKWDTSNVTRMQFTFSNAVSFNQDISGWDVSKVTGFESMFLGATSFNQDIGKWDVSSATSLYRSLKGASSFNQDLSGWCVSNIKTPAHEFNLDGILPPEYMPVWGTCPSG